MNRLVIDVGVSSRFGTRHETGSSTVMERLSSENSDNYGALLAVAEVAGDPGDDDPEKNVITCFKNTFLDVSEYWPVEEALKTSFTSANKAVHSNVYHRHAVTLSSVVIVGSHVFIGHAGNNRVWIYREGRLQQLTSDHMQPRVNQDPVLTRACGMESEIDMEFRCSDIQKGDVFLLTNHQTGEALHGSSIISALVDELNAGRMAETIATAAAESGAQSHISVIVVRVDQVASDSKNVGIKKYCPPVRSLPKSGEMVDEYEIYKRRRKGRLSHYYAATDTLDGSSILLKLPDPGYMATPALLDCFIRDEWLSRQISHPVLVKTTSVARGRRSALYSAMEPIFGENLAKRMKRKGNLSVKEVRLIAGQLLGFLEHLHKQNTLHRDIRPENIILDKASRTIHVLGLDTQRIQYWLKQSSVKALEVLNARYLAPETFSENNDGVQIDIYATGVTLYYLLTGKFPYGRVKSPENMKAKKFRSMTKYNDALPESLVNAINTACAFDPARRFAGAAEFMDALL